MQMKPKRRVSLLSAARFANRAKNAQARAQFNQYLTYNQFNKLTRLESSGCTSVYESERSGDKTLVDVINDHGLPVNYKGEQKPQKLDDIRALVSDEVRASYLARIYKNQPAVAKAMLKREK